VTRKLVYSLLVALLLVVFGSIWFVNHFERVTSKERIGYSALARKNPWLAAQMMFTRMGVNTSTSDSIDAVLATPTTGLIILPGRRATWNEAQRKALLAWVERGGYLIVESNDIKSSDDILDALRVHRKAINYSKPSAEGTNTQEAQGDDEESDEDAPVVKGKPGVAQPERVMHVSLPGMHKPARVWMRGGDSFSTQAAPDFEVHDAYGTHIVGLVLGEGRVTAINDINFMRSGFIGENDQAVFSWELVRLGLHTQGDASENSLPPQAVFYLPERRSFLTWIVDNAVIVACCAASWLLLWLWHVIPRFGPALPETLPGRPQWLAHLRASGRFLWSMREHALLMDVLRRKTLERIARTHADFPHLGQAQRLELLTRAWALSPDDAKRLLDASAPVHVHAHDIIRMAAIAQHVQSKKFNTQLNKTVRTPSPT
jgi:hypothetical protein